MPGPVNKGWPYSRCISSKLRIRSEHFLAGDSRAEAGVYLPVRKGDPLASVRKNCAVRRGRLRKLCA